MRWINNLSIIAKMSVFIVISGIFIFIVGFTGFTIIGLANNAIDETYKDNLLPISYMQENRAHMQVAQAALLRMTTTTDLKEKAELKKELSKVAQTFNDNNDKIRKNNLTEDQRKLGREIDAAMQYMARSSEQMVSSIKSIDILSKDSVAQTQLASAAMHEQTTAMNELSSASRSLAQLAEDLQDSVQKFKI